MIRCNCKFRVVDPTRHEANCNVVLAARLHQKERALAQVEQLIPFPGMESFYLAHKESLQREIKTLTKRLAKETQ